MTNGKANPEIFFELGGKKRKLVFDFWAFYLLEKETGTNVFTGEMFNAMKLSDLLVLTWAALQHEEELSLKQVGQMLQLADLERLGNAIRDAFGLAEVEPKKTVAADAAPAVEAASAA